MELNESDMSLFLQRSEVRLSTQQRVACSFLSGAGLLLLLPVLFKDAAVHILTVIIGILVTGHTLEAFLLFVPFAISLFIPVAALWFLIRGLIKFYFVGNVPEYLPELSDYRKRLDSIKNAFTETSNNSNSDQYIKSCIKIVNDINRLNDSFGGERVDISAIIDTLDDRSGLLSPNDRSRLAREKLNRIITTNIDLMQDRAFLPTFIVPASAFPSSVSGGAKDMCKIKRNLIDRMYRREHALFLSIHREWEASRTLRKLYHKIFRPFFPNLGKSRALNCPPTRENIAYSNTTMRDIKYINNSLTRAGMVDRSLYDEVIFTELCLVRNATNLRVLVMRYAKAVLAVTWTTIISFVVLSAIETSCRFPGTFWTNPIFWISVWYTIWSVALYFITGRPLSWIRDTIEPEFRGAAYTERLMKSFEKIVISGAALALVCSLYSTFIIWPKMTDRTNNMTEEYQSCPGPTAPLRTPPEKNG